MEITRETSIEDVLESYPGLSKVFVELGLLCLVCGEAFWGTVEEIAKQHNMDVDKLIEKLNQRKQERDK
jgi:hybrid cluster-associated redox disulfide protein